MAYNMDRWRELLPDGWRPSWLPQMPFTDYHQLNLDWIIETVKEWSERLIAFFDEDGAKDLVEDVLEEHPEWTTTVMDGSITKSKINTDFLPEIENAYVTPEQFGAIGDGTTDDTAAVQAAINSGLPVIGKNIYKVSEINVTNILYGKFSAHIIHLKDNAVLMGNVENNTHETSSNNPVISIEGQNVTVTNTKIGGLHKGYAITITAAANNAVINKCVFEPSFKNDIFCRGENVTIKYCTFLPHTQNTISPFSEYGNGIKVCGTEAMLYADNGNNIKIIGNTIYEHGDNCMDLYTGGTNVIAANNYCYNPLKIAIEDKLSPGYTQDVNNYKHIYTDNIIIAGGGYRFSGEDYGSGYKPHTIIVNGGIVDNTQSESPSGAIVYALNVPDITFNGGIYKSKTAFINATRNTPVINNAIIYCDIVVVANTQAAQETTIMFSNCKITPSYRFATGAYASILIDSCVIDAAGITAVLFPLANTAIYIAITNSRIVVNNTFLSITEVPILISGNYIETNLDYCVYVTSSSTHKSLIMKNNHIVHATKALRLNIADANIIVSDNIFI